MDGTPVLSVMIMGTAELRSNLLAFSNFNFTGEGFSEVIVSAISLPIRNACSLVLPCKYLAHH